MRQSRKALGPPLAAANGDGTDALLQIERSRFAVDNAARDPYTL